MHGAQTGGFGKKTHLFPPVFCTKFEQFAAEKLVNPTFLNGYRGGARQILASSTVFFNRSLFNEKHFPIPARRMVQIEGTLVILPPPARQPSQMLPLPFEKMLWIASIRLNEKFKSRGNRVENMIEYTRNELTTLNEHMNRADRRNLHFTFANMPS